MARKPPELTIIVVFFNLEDQIRKTLYSLSAAYQRCIEVEDYEVLVIDNGSDKPLPSEWIESLEGRFTCIRRENASPSPAAAVNLGIRMARGRHVGVITDGARLVTPGLLAFALKAFRAFENPVVTALAWHLGPDIQRRAVLQGYSREEEDRLLERIGWPDNGYRLFEISALGGSSAAGWFLPKPESSTLFARKTLFEALGGYDERFDEPGGGLVCHDFYHRINEAPGTELVMLLGEGSFHQLHAGAMTGANQAEAAEKLRRWSAQYQKLTGHPPGRPSKPVNLLGQLPPEARRWLHHSSDALRAQRAE